MTRQLPSSLGFVSLIGGVLFPMLLLVLNSLVSAGSVSFLSGVATRVMLVTFVFFLAGVVGLYVAQEEALGLLGKGMAGILAAALVLTIVEGLLSATSAPVPFEARIAQVAAVLLLVGTIGFGIATARANVLLHARVGGALLALALPLTFLGSFVLNAANVQSSVLTALVSGVPFGIPWAIIGFDLMTIRDYGDVVDGQEAG